MNDQKTLIQEELVTKVNNADPEYKRLMAAYHLDPLHDMEAPELTSEELTALDEKYKDFK
jgi:hypothetical protein